MVVNLANAGGLLKLSLSSPGRRGPMFVIARLLNMLDPRIRGDKFESLIAMLLGSHLLISLSISFGKVFFS